MIKNIRNVEKIFVVDIEYTGKLINAIGCVIMVLDYESGKISIEGEKGFYIKRKPKVNKNNYGDYTKNCWDNYWEKANIVTCNNKLNIHPLRFEKNWRQVANGRLYVNKNTKKMVMITPGLKLDDYSKRKWVETREVKMEYKQREQRLKFESWGTSESEAYKGLMKFFENFCKKNTGVDYRIVGDHPSFDYGLLNADIKRIFKGKMKNFNFVRQWNGGKVNYIHRRPLCVHSFYEGINTSIYGINSKRWFMRDILVLKNTLDTCPYTHDHMPINDAKTIGWKYLTVKRWIRMRNSFDNQ